MEKNNWPHKIGVLMGGYSSERAISLKSGKAILQALIEEGFNAEALDITDQDKRVIESQVAQSGIDLAFIALHGVLGEDGEIQRILESLEIPYTGSGVQASKTALSKTATYELLKNHGVPTTSSVSLKSKDELFSKLQKLSCRSYVVKPANGGSSIGVSFVQSKDSLSQAVDKAFEYDTEIIIEEYIKGREFTVGILEEKPLCVIEICTQNQFFDFQAKYEKGKTQYIVPAELPYDISKRLQELALQTHQIIGCKCFSRVDFLLDEKNRPYVLEINTIPGFTETSLLPMAARHEGITFRQLCRKLVETSYGKEKETRKFSVNS